MLNLIWGLLMVLGVLAASAAGRPDAVANAAAGAARQAVDFLLGLAGVLMLWTGLYRVAERAGLTQTLARLLHPVISRLFPQVPRAHPALEAITANVAANLLGLGNAATPLGLEAMRHLQALNREKDLATPSMCTLLALNTSSVTLVPATVIALRSAAGSREPAAVVVPTLIATFCGSAAALTLDYLLRARAKTSRR